MVGRRRRSVALGSGRLAPDFEYLLTAITCGIGGLIDVAWILWDPRKQALHDKVAKTLVVTAVPPNPYDGR